MQQMLDSLRFRQLVRLIVSKSQLAPIKGVEAIETADRHSDVLKLDEARSFSVHVKTHPIVMQWVAIQTADYLTVAPSIYRLRQILSELSAPAVPGGV